MHSHKYILKFNLIISVILFQALITENCQDDSHWPTELILLREKLTARSQLEIAQMKIKHEEEVSKNVSFVISTSSKFSQYVVVNQ